MTKEALKAERVRRDFTQEQMAAYLADTSLSAYRKWEQGINDVPAWVDRLLFPSEMPIPGLNLGEIVELGQAAQEEGITMDEIIGRYIKEGLKRAKGLIPLIAFFVVGYQAFHPKGEDQFARRFGRRREGAGEVALMEEA